LAQTEFKYRFGTSELYLRLIFEPLYVANKKIVYRSIERFMAVSKPPRNFGERVMARNKTNAAEYRSFER
jgi:hypothetical protein